MKAIIGLGNPGEKYSGTRHNFGFMIVNRFAERKSIIYKAGKGEYVYSKINNHLILIKPTTYMNNSGYAIKSALNYFNIHISDIIIVYDDIDLPIGTMRLREKGQAAGHRGVEDIIYHFSSNIFSRFKMGISNDGQIRPSEKFVLRKFKKDEQKILNEMIELACDALEFLMDHTIEETMNEYNRKSINKRKD